MTREKIFTSEYLEISEADFDKWVIDASSNSLVEALNEYIKLAGKYNVYTDPELTLADNGRNYSQELCNDRISEIHGELRQRDPELGFIAEGMTRPCAEPLHEEPLYIDLETRSQIDLSI